MSVQHIILHVLFYMIGLRFAVVENGDHEANVAAGRHFQRFQPQLSAVGVVFSWSTCPNMYLIVLTCFTHIFLRKPSRQGRFCLYLWYTSGSTLIWLIVSVFTTLSTMSIWRTKGRIYLVRYISRKVPMSGRLESSFFTICAVRTESLQIIKSTVREVTM